MPSTERPGREDRVIDRDAWDARYEGTELLWTAEANRFLVAEAERLAPGAALDVACGEGRNAVWLAERGWDVTAYDFSPVAIGKGAQLAAARGVDVEFLVEDVTIFVPPARAFDLVVVAYLHLADPPRTAVLHAMVGAVATGGTLLVIGHDRSNLVAGYGGPQDPAVLATPDEIAAALDDLTLERAEVVTREVTTPDGPRTALDHVVRAHRA